MMLEAIRGRLPRWRSRIPQGVELFIRRAQISPTADDAEPGPIHDFKKFVPGNIRAQAGNAFQLVHRSAGDPAPPAHFGNFRTAGRRDGTQNQRGLIPHATGGMLVHLDAGNRGKVHRISPNAPFPASGPPFHAGSCPGKTQPSLERRPGNPGFPDRIPWTKKASSSCVSSPPSVFCE